MLTREQIRKAAQLGVPDGHPVKRRSSSTGAIDDSKTITFEEVVDEEGERRIRPRISREADSSSGVEK